ncbi:MAG: TrkH family potassium uptake protein [Candidatus Thermoplasmatota archaeon]|nr:TrkH family potassium uptake protein [Candidatus Thermoplasmatota archaeon]MBS3790718.1 TrkH family potassium uptake protein [Candidatus Thermoplasmatota archaeon]
MRWKVIVGNIGSVLKLFGLAFLVPVIPALWYQEAPLVFGFLPATALVFLFVASFTISLGHPAQAFGRPEDFYQNEAIVIVSLTWIVLALVSSLPFLITGVLTSPIDAFFEAMSGMTTTGATVLPYPLEQHPKSLMLWRGFLQWLGGMGVIVLSVAILTKLSSGGLSLLEAESPGPTMTRLKPKIKETAKWLWYLYGLLTLMQVLMLLGAKVSLYDAVYHSFTTMATGGFSPHTGSIGYFSSTVQWIIIFFMIMAGTNFALHYQVFRGNIRNALKNSEFRTYLAIIFGATVFITLVNVGTTIGGELPIISDIRHSLFQAVSIMTTTGYATVNFDKWPEVLRLLLLILMFIGGSAGSTGGGMKVMRVLLVFKMIKRKFKQFINPRRVEVVRMGDSVIDEKVLDTVVMFFCGYLIIFAVGAFIMVGMGLDIVSGIAASATTIGNVGPGLGMVGPENNFRAVPLYGRLVLSLLMWIGRLEVFTAIALFSPQLYKKRKLRSILSFRKS